MQVAVAAQGTNGPVLRRDLTTRLPLASLQDRDFECYG